MRTKGFSFRIQDPDLAKVFSEIAERICYDDWERRSTPGGEFVYYVVGFEAHRVDAEGIIDFESDFPLPSQSSPLTQWFTKAQVAAKQPDYVHAARSRLVGLGVPDEKVDAFLAFRLDELKTLHLSKHPQLLAAFANLLEAAVVARGGAADDLDSDDLRRISRDRRKAYLREMSKKYADILRRIDQLEALDFSDPQLEEASHCYLYGFNRAAVVLAAASVETHLKRITGKDRFKEYKELTDTAFWAGRLDGPRREAARKVFQIRRQVVHDGVNPSIDETASTLALARSVVESLHQ